VKACSRGYRVVTYASNYLAASDPRLKVAGRSEAYRRL
jgi:hypothetical protein